LKVWPFGLLLKIIWRSSSNTGSFWPVYIQH